jgi:NAD(P)-dependent dehydrogenase (short-subunit alcohol dehydrogenase family)
MTMKSDDLWGYLGRPVAVDGAASGMGLAVTRLLLELGAKVYALDVKEVPAPVKEQINTDLSDRSSIDSAVQKLPKQVRAVFCCAGLPGPPFDDGDVITVNFVGHRYLIEQTVPRMSEDGAIAIISSLAGAAWRLQQPLYRELLDTGSFEEGKAWAQSNVAKVEAAGGSYPFSKACINAYGRAKAAELAHRGIRLNVVSPSTTETPMLPYFREQLGDTLEQYKVGRFATAEEMAYPLVFLNSAMASYISGQELMVDRGLTALMELAQAAA